MDKEVLDKLMEIKNLYEAGILTKEEMEGEKAKILHSSDGTTDKQDEPVVEETEIAPKTLLWVALAVIVVLVIVLVAANNKSSNNNDSPSYNEEYVDVDSCITDDSPSYNEEYVDVDSCITDDSHEYFDMGTGESDVDY